MLRLHVARARRLARSHSKVDMAPNRSGLSRNQMESQGLPMADKVKVSNANKLYALIAEILQAAQESGLL